MKVGFGRSDITPRLGVQLAGYGPYRNRAAKRILAPLSARAMAVTGKGGSAILLSLDLCVIPRPLGARIREMVATRTGCRPDNVFLGATHTHSAPALGGMSGWGEADGLYVSTLPSRAAEAAEKAWAARREAVWRYGEGPCEGIAVNREIEEWFASKADMDERLGPGWRPKMPELTDPTSRVLAAYGRKGKLLGFLHHFGCHLVVCAEKTNEVHGDFAGLAANQFEREHPGAVSIFLPGAQGDINPCLNHREANESRRAVRGLAKRYHDAVARALRGAKPIEADVVASVAKEGKFSRTKPSRKEIGKRIAKIERLFEAPGVTDFPWAGDPPLHTRGMELARLEGLRRVLERFEGNRAPNRPVRLHGLRIGPVALLGAGIEIYHSLQQPIMDGSPHPHTWVVSLVGGHGYAQDAAAQRRAGYANDFVPLVQGELPYKKIYDELPRELIKLSREL